MHSRIFIPAAPHGQRCCLVLFKSSTGELQPEYLLVPTNSPPEVFLQHVKDLYRSKFSNAKQAYYRCMFLSRPVVSTVNIWEINPSGGGYNAFIREADPDKTLTEALGNPERLAGMPAALFLRDYGSIFLEPHHNANLPASAIMIHLQTDPMAAKIAGFLVSAASLGLGIGLKVAGV